MMEVWMGPFFRCTDLKDIIHKEAVKVCPKEECPNSTMNIDKVGDFCYICGSKFVLKDKETPFSEFSIDIKYPYTAFGYCKGWYGRGERCYFKPGFYNDREVSVVDYDDGSKRIEFDSPQKEVLEFEEDNKELKVQLEKYYNKVEACWGLVINDGDD